MSKELNNLFAAAKDTPEYNAIELLSLRTMAKARYDTENLGHYGLAFKSRKAAGRTAAKNVAKKATASRKTGK